LSAKTLRFAFSDLELPIFETLVSLMQFAPKSFEDAHFPLWPCKVRGGDDARRKLALKEALRLPRAFRATTSMPLAQELLDVQEFGLW